MATTKKEKNTTENKSNKIKKNTKIRQKDQNVLSIINSDNKFPNEFLALIFNILKKYSLLATKQIIDYMSKTAINSGNDKENRHICPETDFLYELAQFMEEESEYEALVAIYDTAIEIIDKKFGKNSIEMIIAENRQAKFYLQWGDLDDAENILIKTKAKLKKLGKNPELTIITMKNLLTLNRFIENEKQALHLMEKLLPLMTEHYGLNNPETHKLICELNDFYCRYNQSSIAEKMLKNVLQKMKKVKADNLFQADIMDFLTSIYLEEGKSTKDAIKYAEKSIALKEACLQPNNRSFASNYLSLAFLYSKQLNSPQVEHFCDLYIKNITENRLSPDPQYFLLLANTYLEQNKLEKAIEPLEIAFEIFFDDDEFQQILTSVIINLWTIYKELENHQKMDWLICKLLSEFSGNIQIFNNKGYLFIPDSLRNEEDEDDDEDEGEDKEEDDEHDDEYDEYDDEYDEYDDYDEDEFNEVADLICTMCLILGNMAHQICEVECFGPEKALEIMQNLLSEVRNCKCPVLFRPGIFLGFAKIYAEIEDFANAADFCKKAQRDLWLLTTNIEGYDLEDIASPLNDIKMEVQELLAFCTEKTFTKPDKTVINVDFNKRTRS